MNANLNTVSLIHLIRSVIVDKILKTTCQFLFHCPNFINERTLLLNDVSRITKDALPSCETAFVKLLLYGDDSFDSATNTLILNASLEYILSSKRFDGPLS